LHSSQDASDIVADRESEVRWLSEQLEAANTRNAQETDYMSAQLESER